MRAAASNVSGVGALTRPLSIPTTHQSKASCMPAHALAPAPGWSVVDACAAPGNKTTHLAALMANRGCITAFEARAWEGGGGPERAGLEFDWMKRWWQDARAIGNLRGQLGMHLQTCCCCLCLSRPSPQKDARRLERLRGNAALTGATCIDAQHADFLATEPEAPAFAGVQALLLDPSCSGSGTAFTRMDYLLPSSADRLKGGGGRQAARGEGAGGGVPAGGASEGGWLQ